MDQVKYSGGSIWAVVTALALTAAGGPAHAAEKSIDWTDAGSSHDWTDAYNWDPNWVGGPANDGYWEFLVTIGCTAPDCNPATVYDPVYFDATNAPVDITDFFLDDDSRLVLNTGTDLMVLRTAEIAGIIDGRGGDFTATASAAFADCRSRVYGSAGSVITICAPTYCSEGLFTGGSSTWTLMSGVDVGTLLDISCLAGIDAGFNDSDSSYHQTIHKITASSGAEIDLSGVATITGPTQWDDRLEIEVLGATSVINLDGVQMITVDHPTVVARGQVYLEAYDGAALELPSASSFHHTCFFAETGGAIHANQTPATLSLTDLFNSSSSTWYLMNAEDAGTLLDLPAFTEIDAGFNDSDSSYHQTIHKITASSGAEIDLSGVATITGPTQWDDRLEIEVLGATSVINLDGVQMITVDHPTVVARGQVYLEAYDGAALELPSASSFHHTCFFAETGGAIHANQTPATLSSTELFSSGSSTWSLMNAEDAGTLLDLPAFTEIDAGFNDSDSSYHQTIHKITASSGAEIDLSGVATITGPAQSDDRLEIDAAGGTINLSGLQWISSAGSGDVRVYLSCGGHVSLGDVSITGSETTIDLDTESRLTLGSLQADVPVAITLNSDSDRLEVTGSLWLEDDITITAAAGATLSVGGDLLYTHQDTAALSLGGARVECVGDSQQVEVGGADYYLSVGAIPDDNFGYGQLIVGEPGHACRVELVDLYDNHEPGVPDVLYLGLADVPGPGGVESLQIRGGSTLVIHDLDVYALLDMDEDGTTEWTVIRDLFPAGETVIRFDHNGNDGFIATEDFAYDYVHWAVCMTGPAGTGYGPGCSVFDVEPDGDVDLADFAEFSIALTEDAGGCFIAGSTPGDGWIDARQPLDDTVNQNPVGWDSIELTFHGGCEASSLTVADFSLAEVCEPGECDGSGPAIASYVGTGDTGTLTLDRPIDPMAWTVITYHGRHGDEFIRLGYLPADADGSGASQANDLLEVVDAAGECGRLHQYDIDRSGTVNATDITVLIDLHNGSGPFESYLGKRLPPLP